MSYTANLGNDKTRHVGIPAGNVQLDGELQIPVGASGVIYLVSLIAPDAV